MEIPWYLGIWELLSFYPTVKLKHSTLNAYDVPAVRPSEAYDVMFVLVFTVYA